MIFLLHIMEDKFNVPKVWTKLYTDHSQDQLAILEVSWCTLHLNFNYQKLYWMFHSIKALFFILHFKIFCFQCFSFSLNSFQNSFTPDPPFPHPFYVNISFKIYHLILQVAKVPIRKSPSLVTALIRVSLT